MSSVTNSSPAGKPDYSQITADQQQLEGELVKLDNDTAALQRAIKQQNDQQKQGGSGDKGKTDSGQTGKAGSVTAVGSTASNAISAAQAVVVDSLSVAVTEVKLLLDVLSESPVLPPPLTSTQSPQGVVSSQSPQGAIAITSQTPTGATSVTAEAPSPAIALSTAAKAGNPWLAANAFASFFIAYTKAIAAMVQLDAAERKQKVGTMEGILSLGQDEAQAQRDAGQAAAQQKIIEAAESGAQATFGMISLGGNLTARSRAKSQLEKDSPGYKELETKIQANNKKIASGAGAADPVKLQAKNEQYKAKQEKMIEQRRQIISENWRSSTDVLNSLTRMGGKIAEAHQEILRTQAEAQKTILSSESQVEGRGMASAFDYSSKARDEINNLVQALIQAEQTMTQMLKMYMQS